MSHGDWLVALGGLFTALGALVTIVIDVRQPDDLTELQEKIFREETKRWADGGKKDSAPDGATAGEAAKKMVQCRRRKRLVPLGALAGAAVCAIVAGLIVG